jgi:SAM-dependent methyltransferase
MHEILQRLDGHARALDLGSRAGSFAASANRGITIRVDLNPAAQTGDDCQRFVDLAVAGDAAELPFASRSFDAVISNHSLEHFERLDEALGEIGRVLKPGGSLYVAVPDASTFTDRLYRWLARGGGHVNPFVSAEELTAHIARATGLPHVATRTLSTSLSFLNRRNMAGPAPLRIRWFVALGEPALAALTAVLRWADKAAGTRLSVYGWAFYFGPPLAIDTARWSNACIRCGSGHPADALVRGGAVRRCLGLLRSYACPRCGAANVFTQDGSCVS